MPLISSDSVRCVLQIEVRHVSDPSLLLRGVLQHSDAAFNVMVCNPPFFSSLDQTGLHPARAGPAGTHSELVCAGGEERFVADLITQSKELWIAAGSAENDGTPSSAALSSSSSSCRIRWCSSMIGRKAS